MAIVKGSFTDGSRVKVGGEFFEIRDLREHKTSYPTDCTYYGSKRTYMLKKEYSEQDAIDKQKWEEAIEVNNGDAMWIDGVKYHLVVKDLSACDGLMFVRDDSMRYIEKAIKDRKC